MKIILKDKLPELFAQISENYQLFVPALTAGLMQFLPYEKGLKINLERNVDLPPKDIFFPQTEKMYTFKTKKQGLEIQKIKAIENKQIVFGIRSCDLKSIEYLDYVFLSENYTDTFYQKKREQTILIALACVEPNEACFCTSLGIDPEKGEIADIQVYDLVDKLAFEPQTKQGIDLMQSFLNLFSEEEAVLPMIKPQKTTVSLEGVPEKLKLIFEHPLWDKISRKCLSCNICTYLCPTCYCFDLSSEVRGLDGQKIRCWDSCMSGDFTLMAGEHQPRAGKKERLRNRFLHKLQYFPERYQVFLCTGCGRCRTQCPVNLDIVDVIQKINEISIENLPGGEV